MNQPPRLDFQIFLSVKTKQSFCRNLGVNQPPRLGFQVFLSFCRGRNPNLDSCRVFKIFWSVPERDKRLGRWNSEYSCDQSRNKDKTTVARMEDRNTDVMIVAEMEDCNKDERIVAEMSDCNKGWNALFLKLKQFFAVETQGSLVLWTSLLVVYKLWLPPSIGP